MINREGRVKIKNMPNVTELAGEKVMVDFEQGKYFMIKGTGNDIWDMLQENKNITPGQIIEKLLEEYEVSPEECEASVMEFLGKMQELGFIA